VRGLSNSFESIIHKLKGRRKDSDREVCVAGEEYVFTFYKTCDSTIDVKEGLHSFELPEDYVSFMRQYSSATLFQDIEYGSIGCTILNVHNVIEYWKAYSIDHPYYPIAWSSHSLGCVCVDQDRLQNDSGYLTWIPSMDPDSPIDIHLTFTEWLNKLIENDGKEFWIPSF
jgi:hypothetical protein